MSTKEEVATAISKQQGISRETAKDIVNEISWEIADVLDMGLGQNGAIEILSEFGLDATALSAFM